MEDEMNWYLMVLKKYAQFSGRSRRKEYWMFTLFHCLIAILLCVLSLLLRDSGLSPVVSIVFGLYLLAVLVPSLAVSVRRLHDTGKSGWWILIGLVPAVGGLILLIFVCLDSVPGPNEYGPNPKLA
jgi:uncharacterized membrane protein YhaH (DUF805 family)